MFNVKTIIRVLTTFAILPLLAFSVACGEDPTPGNEPGNEDDPNNGGNDKVEEYEDIKVVDGKVRFYLKEKEGATRTATNMKARDWATSSVQMNGKSYKVEFTDEKTPRPYVEVAEAESYSATLLTSNSSKWLGGGNEVKLPYSQIYHTAIANIKSFPMYASYTKENGNKLIFNDGFALVYLRLKGSAKISSVKVASPTGRAIAGISTLLTSKGEYSVNNGVDFAVLNCTNSGSFVQLSSSKNTHFRVMVAPGTYSQGLEISICDKDRGAMFITTEPLTLAAGEVHTIDAEYACEEDIAFYEAFDNFVWGGDPVKGSEGKGFAPDGTAVTKNNCLDRTGYEEAFTQVDYNNPGSAYFQADDWNAVKSSTVATSHQVTDNYIDSRNIRDWGMLFRTQEFAGCLGVGISYARGIVRLPAMANMKGIGDVVVKVDFALQEKFADTFEMSTMYGGVIKEAKVNGQPISLSTGNLTYSSTISKAASMVVADKVFIPSAATVANQWNQLEVTISGATNSTIISFQKSSASGSPGIYIDKIEARRVNDWSDDGNLRVLYWNIQNGMISDQHNNYNNFVAWVKKYDPDVCIWCESETIYKDKSGTTAASSKFLPDGWGQLAARYGHPYAAVGANVDNYPQTITSKYPIQTIRRISETDNSSKPISHGAGHFAITINGKRVNFVTMHMWAMGYSYEVVKGTQAEKDASIANLGGDYYREYEMKYLVDNTVNNPSYKDETLWLFGGDTNSKSPKDQWFYGTSAAEVTYLPHKYVLENTTMKDVIADRYSAGTHFMTSTYFNSRIDILYASPAMFDAMLNSAVVMDEWTALMPEWSFYSTFHDPSDHRPILMDFNF